MARPGAQGWARVVTQFHHDGGDRIMSEKIELFRALEVKEIREDRELGGYYYYSDLWYLLSGEW
jgi:hypothetical protein